MKLNIANTLKLLLAIVTLLNFSTINSQENNLDKTKIAEDLKEIITEIKNNYVYLGDKKVAIDCIEQTYARKIDQLKTESETLLFFEYLLDEFYDSHIMLMRNSHHSFRLHSPVYAIVKEGKFYIKNVWPTEVKNIELNIINAEIIKFNDISFSKKIKDFPTVCTDKNDTEVREWIANKVLSGRYSEPRMLTLKLENGTTVNFDLDALKYKNHTGLLESKRIGDIGVIRINDALGNNDLIVAFDRALNTLFTTKGLIIDLRNTASGGGTYIARGIMSRFIAEDLPYQKHQILDEKWDNKTFVKRSWVEYVSPRGKQYKQPVVVLVNRWTGSMGEGLAVGFDGLKRAKIVGTEMKRLAGGSTSDFGFIHQQYNFKLITQKLFHINGTPREEFVPEWYVKQTTPLKDETLERGLELLKK
ncbi:MAG: hypothetical protein JKY02_07785 [Flavobacteriaceae bacterium]|nr:hypothetical protein [Flavobacteriaceae bacterium]